MRKLTTTLALLLACAASSVAQQTTYTLNDPSTTVRFQRTIDPVVNYDFLITSGGLFNVRSGGLSHLYFGPAREFTINRMPGVERVLSVNGSNSSLTDHYVTSLWIDSGSLNPQSELWWNVAQRIASPRNPLTLKGWSIGNFTENFDLPNGAGFPYWYEGPNSLVWAVDGKGNPWTYRINPMQSSNWERGGCWWDANEAEYYCGTQAANQGIQRPFVLKGSLVEVESPFVISDTVTVQGHRGFTGQCLAGQSPVFLEGIAIGCQ